MEKIFKWWDYPLFILLTAIMWAAIFSFLRNWFSFHDWFYYPVSFSILTLIVLLKIATHQFRWFMLPLMRRPQQIIPVPGIKVGVVTTFVPGGESLEMLEETVKALVHLDHPHDTWVLDEGDDEQVKALCNKFGARHFSRKHLARYQTKEGLFKSRSKHGNYNAWFYEIGFAQYEIVTAFDPDHVPEKVFLTRVLGYFQDPSIGYVQAAQAYYNQQASFIARGAAEETYAYYSSMQMSCYAMGHPIVTGCHNTHRVSALEEVAGFAPHDADDLMITLLYRSHGWKGVYLPEILAKGLTPVDWDGYLTQQLRWARSVLDIKFRVYPRLAGKLSLKEQAISLLHGLYYLQGLTTAIGLGLLIFMLFTGIIPKVTSHLSGPLSIGLLIVLQLGNFYLQRFYLDFRREWGLHVRAGILRYAKWPYLLLALWEVILDRSVPYTLTHKMRRGVSRYPFLWPHIVTAALICGAAIFSVFVRLAWQPALYLWAAVIGLCSLLLVFSEYMPFPDPYDPSLSPSLKKGDVRSPASTQNLDGTYAIFESNESL